MLKDLNKMTNELHNIIVSEQGYVAIDFYDGSIMFDFSNKRTIICDIDYYSKMPYINTIGRMLIIFWIEQQQYAFEHHLFTIQASG
jgi:hypothetical protein